MPDGRLQYTPPPPLDDLRGALRQPHAFDPPLRILAEGVLGADSQIDLIGVDPRGRVVLVLIAEGSDDAGLLTRGLAQRAWVEPRLRDWLQLGPGLEISAAAPVVAALLSPGFSPETRAAADALGPDVVELWSCRCVRDATSLAVLLEPLTAPGRPPDAPSPQPDPTASPGAPEIFRSGLSEDDLGLAPEETREFE